MKYTKLSLALLLVAGSLQAGGGGKTFGAVLGGTMLGNALSPRLQRRDVVVVKDGSNSRITNRAVQRLNNDIDDIYETLEKHRKEMKELKQRVSDLENQKNESNNK